MHPILFRLPFEVPVYSYGTMLGLSLALGWYLTLGLGEKEGLDRTRLRWCFLWTAGAAVVGARLLFLLTGGTRPGRLVDLLGLWRGGLVAYGGFLGGLAGSAVFCRLRGMRLLAWADCAVPSLCVGLIITRLGCLMYGCDFGVPWDGPWAIRFPRGSPACEEHVAQGWIAPDASESLPVHPTEVYESLAGLVLLVVVLGLRRRRHRIEGEGLAAFAIGYAALRCPLELLRGDAGRGAIGPFSTSQIIGLVTLVAAGALMARLRAGRSFRGACPG